MSECHPDFFDLHAKQRRYSYEKDKINTEIDQKIEKRGFFTSKTQLERERYARHDEAFNSIFGPCAKRSGGMCE